MFKRVKNEKGATTIVIVMAITILIAMSALVIDIGLAMNRRIAFSNAVDSATLAGAMALPLDPSEAVALGNEYMTMNGFSPDNVTITIADENHSIEVKGTVPHNYFLAPIIGIDSTILGARAKAIVGPAGSSRGLRPFAVEDQNYEYGQQVVLKEEAGDSEKGNFGAVAFDQQFGTSIFKENIYFGYTGDIGIGDIINTEPGNMASSISTVKDVISAEPLVTFETFEAGSERVWVIPIVKDLNVAGRDEIVIVKFAAFFIEDIGKKSGQTEITGRFIEYTTNGTVDGSAPDTGVYALKLIE